MKTVKTAIAAMALSISTGCSTVATTTDYDAEASFTGYRTFQIESKSTLPTPLTREIEGSITGELVRRGLVPAEEGDVIVNYFTLVNDRTTVTETPDVTLVQYRRGYTVWNTYETEIRTVTAGTLFVDVIDADTDRLIWEGYVEGVVSRGNLQRNIRRISEAVIRLFEDLPLGASDDE